MREEWETEITWGSEIAWENPNHQNWQGIQILLKSLPPLLWLLVSPVAPCFLLVLPHWFSKIPFVILYLSYHILDPSLIVQSIWAQNLFLSSYLISHVGFIPYTAPCGLLIFFNPILFSFSFFFVSHGYL